MNYKEVYDRLCYKAKSEKREKGKGVHYEAHHILPKSLGGEGSAREWRTHPNIVLLTPKEHITAHKLLWYNDPKDKRLFWAYHTMTKMNAKTNSRNPRLTHREYHEIRTTQVLLVSGDNAPSKRPEVAKKISESQKGKILSDETKLKVTEGLKKYYEENPGLQKGRKATEQAKINLSNAKKGKPANPKTIEALVKSNLGKKRSDETRKLLSDRAKQRPPMHQEIKDKISKSVTAVQTGKPCKEETKLKISQKLMGHKSFRTGPTSEETKKKISEAQKGKKLSDEHRLKLSIAAKNRKRKPLSEETKRKIGDANRKQSNINE